MKRLIALTFLLATTLHAERLRMYTDRTAQDNVIAGPVRIIDTTNQTGSIELDGVAIEKWSDISGGGSGSVLTVQRVLSGVTTEVSEVSTLVFDGATGFNLDETDPNTAFVSLGSSWTTIHTPAGITNISPSGEQPIRFEVSSNVLDVTVITNPAIDSYTIQFPISAGEQGPRGFPGFTYANYAGTWDASETYSTNQWLIYAGTGYGVNWTNWAPGSGVPSDYTASGALITLFTSGEDGSDGLDGDGLTMYGDWASNVDYPADAMVRYTDGVVYYTKVSSSNQIPGVTANWAEFVRDGTDGSAVYVTSNTIWGGSFDASKNYVSNTIVYVASPGYGMYLAVTNALTAEYNPGGLPTPFGIDNTTYFKRIGYYGRDGADGEDGLQGADGIGNMWYRPEGYDDLFTFTNAGIVVTHNDETYVTKTGPFDGIEPGVNINWTTYWNKMASKGANGGAYRFELGWNASTEYAPDDVVISTNIFFLCTSSGNAGIAPWLPAGASYWDTMIDPAYRNYGLAPSRAWVGAQDYATNELVRYNGSTYAVINPVTNASVTPNLSSDYAIFAQKGDTGATGQPGDDGITTVIYTNQTSNIWETVNYYETNNYFTTNFYTTDVSAVSFSEGTSNNVVLDAGLLSVEFNTNYLTDALSDGNQYVRQNAAWVPVVIQDQGITNILDLYTSATDTDLVLKPDGANGVAWGTASAGTITSVTGDPYITVANGEGPTVELSLVTDGLVLTNDTTYTDTVYKAATEPIWTSYLANAFTNDVTALVESVAVTGAVTSINGLDGAVTISAGDNVNITTNGNTLTISADDAITGVTIDGGSATTNAGVVALTVESSGGVATIPLNGASALDWGVLNGTMGRITSNGYSTLYGDNDVFRYTDSLPIYSSAGGEVTTNYFGCWRDANATVQIIQQVSDDNGATWDAVTNAISATTTPTVFGLSGIDLATGANLYRVAIETNATSGTIYIYQIDARGQL